MSKKPTDTTRSNEGAAMEAAFAALRGHSAAVTQRMLLWIEDRLAEERRARQVGAFRGAEPEEWVFLEDEFPGTPGRYDTREEGLAEIEPIPWAICEVTALATVHQEFLVAVPIGDGEVEYESFPTRQQAADFILARSEGTT